MNPAMPSNWRRAIGGHLAVPATHDVACPKCDSANADRQHHITQISHDGGSHFECEVCAHVWDVPERDR